MKISPATQLIMKAIARASARRLLNLNLPAKLNPWGPRAPGKKNLKRPSTRSSPA